MYVRWCVAQVRYTNLEEEAHCQRIYNNINSNRNNIIFSAQSQAR